jgi:hypothetical protein
MRKARIGAPRAPFWRSAPRVRARDGTGVAEDLLALMARDDARGGRFTCGPAFRGCRWSPCSMVPRHTLRHPEPETRQQAIGASGGHGRNDPGRQSHAGGDLRPHSGPPGQPAGHPSVPLKNTAAWRRSGARLGYQPRRCRYVDVRGSYSVRATSWPKPSSSPSLVPPARRAVDPRRWRTPRGGFALDRTRRRACTQLRIRTVARLRAAHGSADAPPVVGGAGLARWDLKSVGHLPSIDTLHA